MGLFRNLFGGERPSSQPEIFDEGRVKENFKEWEMGNLLKAVKDFGRTSLSRGQEDRMDKIKTEVVGRLGNLLEKRRNELYRDNGLDGVTIATLEQWVFAHNKEMDDKAKSAAEQV